MHLIGTYNKLVFSSCLEALKYLESVVLLKRNGTILLGHLFICVCAFFWTLLQLRLNLNFIFWNGSPTLLDSGSLDCIYVFAVTLPSYSIKQCIKKKGSVRALFPQEAQCLFHISPLLHNPSDTPVK